MCDWVCVIDWWNDFSLHCHHIAIHFPFLSFISYNTFTFFASLHFNSLHFTSTHFTSLHFTLLYFTLLYFTLLHFTSLHFNSLQLTSLHFNSPFIPSFTTWIKIFNYASHDSCQHQHPSFLVITPHYPILLTLTLFTVFVLFHSRRAVTHPKAPPHPQYHRAAIVLGKYLHK